MGGSPYIHINEIIMSTFSISLMIYCVLFNVLCIICLYKYFSSNIYCIVNIYNPSLFFLGWEGEGRDCVHDGNQNFGSMKTRNSSMA